MKKILIALVAVLIAFVFYDQHQREVRAAKAAAQAAEERAEELRLQSQAQAAAIKEQTEALAARAADLNQQAETLHAETTALKQEVAAEHEAAAAQREEIVATQQRFQTKAYRMEGLSAAQGVKQAIAQRFGEFGKLPGSNREAGVAEPEKFAGQSLRRLDVGRNGMITLTFDEKSGVDNGRIQLIPDTATQPTLKWRCVSPDFEDITVTSALCEFKPPEKI